MTKPAADTPEREKDNGQVYFVEIGKYIKIGFTTNLQQRLKSFLTSSPYVDLLLAMPGDRALEQTMHQNLQECRIERELFRRDHRILEFIRHFEYGGIERAMQYLAVSDPNARAKQKADDHTRRVAVARKNRAEKDAYFASLVEQRKNRIGW